MNSVFRWSLVVTFCAFTLSVLSAADFPGLGPIGLLTTVQFEPAEDVLLRGPNDRAQLLVTGRYSSGQSHDLTHAVSYQVSTAGIVRVDADGFVTPLADGEVAVTATSADGKTSSVKCRVENFASPRPINFSNEIVPIFTKAAQLFLGLRIQCARCHHHPFKRWSQNDYYGFEAFFSQVGLKPNRKAVQNAIVFHRGGPATARNPRTLTVMVQVNRLWSRRQPCRYCQRHCGLCFSAGTRYGAAHFAALVSSMLHTSGAGSRSPR